MNYKTLLMTAAMILAMSIVGCDNGSGSGGGSGTGPVVPVLAAPNATGDIVISGTAPNYTGACGMNDNLALNFTATDADTSDILTTTISVTGGTITPVQAGFTETFPYSPTGSVSPHTVALSGTAAMLGRVEFDVSVTDGLGGSDNYTLIVRIGGAVLDFNGDGYDDVIVGADVDDDGGTDSGCAFIFFGSASPSATIDASNADVKLVGEGAYDYFGYSVSTAGDVNGDGYDDVIVGAVSDNDGGFDSGCAFIFFGSASPSATIDASNADMKLVGGDVDDWFGNSVSTAGDVNGDGYDDVIVGALSDDDGGADSGCAFIFFGSASPSATIDASNADVKLVGQDTVDRFGLSVSTADDINGDGYDDVIVGAPYDDDGGTYSGCAFIFFGSASPSATIDASNADVKLVGGDADDYFGISVSTAGDVNGDGYDDVIVGASGDDDGGTESGCASIFFGSASPSATIDASNADVKLVGQDADDSFGYSVSTAGDVNGDGYDDVIVGAYVDDDGGTSSGCAFIFFGSASPSASIDASNADVKLVGENGGDFFGYSVSTAGDVNGDGYDDVIVGAYSDSDGGTASGCAFFFFGSATPSATIDASIADIKLVGEDAYDYFGYSVGG